MTPLAASPARPPLAPATKPPFGRRAATRESAIDEWEKKEGDKLAERWADGKITLLRVAIEAEKIEEKANAMRDELRDNCRMRANQDSEQRTSRGDAAGCVNARSGETLEVVKDAAGDLFPVVGLDSQSGDPARPGSVSSCGVSVYAEIEKDESGMWAGYVRQHPKGERVRVSIYAPDGHRRLEGWVRPGRSSFK